MGNMPIEIIKIIQQRICLIHYLRQNKTEHQVIRIVPKNDMSLSEDERSALLNFIKNKMPSTQDITDASIETTTFMINISHALPEEIIALRKIFQLPDE